MRKFLNDMQATVAQASRLQSLTPAAGTQSAAADLAHCPAGHQSRQIARHRLTQRAAAHHCGPDALTFEVWLQSAPRGFNFRQLRHLRSSAVSIGF